MRHTDNHFFHTVFADVLHQIVQGQNRALAAFHAEAFLADVFVLQVAFQRFGGSELFQDEAFFVGTVFGRGGDAFKIVPHPMAFGAVGNVHVFDTDRAAIGLFQLGQDFRQSQFFVLSAEIAFAHIEFNRHVGIGKAVEFGIQAFDEDRRFAFERVELRGIDTLNAVGGNQAQHGNLFFQHRFVGRADRNGTGFRQPDKRFLNRPVRHIALGIARLRGQFGKILPPIFFHRVRVV